MSSTIAGRAAGAPGEGAGLGVVVEDAPGADAPGDEAAGDEAAGDEAAGDEGGGDEAAGEDAVVGGVGGIGFAGGTGAAAAGRGASGRPAGGAGGGVGVPDEAACGAPVRAGDCWPGFAPGEAPLEVDAGDWGDEGFWVMGAVPTTHLGLDV